MDHKPEDYYPTPPTPDTHPTRIPIEQAEQIFLSVKKNGLLGIDEIRRFQEMFKRLKSSNTQSVDINPHSAENVYDSSLGELAKFLKEYHSENRVTEPLSIAVIEQKSEQEPTIEKLREDIFKQEGLVMFASLPVHQDKTTEGFVFDYSSNLVPQKIMSNIPDILLDPYGTGSSFFKENYVTEIVLFIPQLKPRVATTTRQEQYGLFKRKTRAIQEEQITGVEDIAHSEIVQNGTNDPAVCVSYTARGIDYDLPYRDYTDRVGQEFNIRLFISKQLADQLYKQLQDNPKLIRAIVEDAIVGKGETAGRFSTIMSEKEWVEGFEYRGGFM